MAPLVDYESALAILFSLRRFGMRPSLDGVRALLAKLGNPEQALRVIHVAGTNGKGSTCAFIDSMLRANGTRTGLFTSPHLNRFTERFVIDGVEVTREELARHVHRVIALDASATFFEVCTAVAFTIFAERNVDVAIMETGLGGLWDATNVVNAPLCTAITSIGHDHLDILGATLPEVARQKAGIFKTHVPAVVACDDAAALTAIEDVAQQTAAALFRFGYEFHCDSDAIDAFSYRGPGGALSLPHLSLAGAHQRVNASVALAVVAQLPAALQPTLAARKSGLANAVWPGRFECLATDLWVDGAHNAEGAIALAAELALRKISHRLVIIVGMVQEKSPAEVLAPLALVADELILTDTPSSRGRPASELLAWAPGAHVETDFRRAIEHARKSGGAPALIIVTGSLFLVGAVRAWALHLQVDPIVVSDPGGLQR